MPEDSKLLRGLWLKGAKMFDSLWVDGAKTACVKNAVFIYGRELSGGSIILKYIITWLFFKTYKITIRNDVYKTNIFKFASGDNSAI